MARINQIWKYDYEEGAFPITPSKMQEIVNGTNDLYEGKEELDLKNVKSYNMLQNGIQSQVINGVTITREKDGTLIFNGTSTTAFRIYLFVGELTLKQGTYTFSSNKSGTVSANIYFTMSAEDTTDDFNLNPFNAERKKITLSKDTKFLNCNLYVGGNRTFNNLKISLMLQEGEENKPYEPHLDLFELQEEYLKSRPFIAWTNANPTNEFIAQTINVNDDIEKYQYYEIVYRRIASGQTYISSGRMPVNLRHVAETFTNGFAFSRAMSEVPSGKNFHFANCAKYGAYGNTNNTIDNTLLIPYQIILYR